MGDALAKAAELLGVPAPLMADGKVVVAAFSGGWWPAAATLRQGGLGGRIAAVVLIDAHYGGAAAFLDWIEARRTDAAFVSLYTRSSAPGAEALIGGLILRNIETQTALPDRIGPGTVALVRVETPHLQVVREGPPRFPLAAILRRLPPFDDAVPDLADPPDLPETPDPPEAPDPPDGRP